MQTLAHTRRRRKGKIRKNAKINDVKQVVRDAFINFAQYNYNM